MPFIITMWIFSFMCQSKLIIYLTDIPAGMCVISIFFWTFQWDTASTQVQHLLVILQIVLT